MPKVQQTFPQDQPPEEAHELPRGPERLCLRECHKAFLTKYHLTRHLKICKGPKTERASRKEQDVDEEEDEEEEDEDDGRGRGGGRERLVDSASNEDCGLDVGGYNSEKSLSPPH